MVRRAATGASREAAEAAQRVAAAELEGHQREHGAARGAAVARKGWVSMVAGTAVAVLWGAMLARRAAGQTEERWAAERVMRKVPPAAEVRARG